MEKSTNDYKNQAAWCGGMIRLNAKEEQEDVNNKEKADTIIQENELKSQTH